MVAFILLFLLSKNRRLISGCNHLLKSKDIDFLLYVSIVLFSLIIISNLNSEFNIIYLIPISLIFMLSITAFFLLKKKIRELYFEKLKTNEVIELNESLEKLKFDNERMAYQIHKDNKILPVIQLTLLELIKGYGETDRTRELQTQLDILTKERHEVLQTSVKGNTYCNIPSTDAIFQYYSNRGKHESVDFKFEIDDNALSQTTFPINELNTVLCDLLENALIAVRSAEDKKVLVKINSKDGRLNISVFDNGKPFAEEFLEKMGKERITTHSETGGSGIGLMTIFEILDRNNGKFEVEKCSSIEKYTKKVMIIWGEK